MPKLIEHNVDENYHFVFIIINNCEFFQWKQFFMLFLYFVIIEKGAERLKDD